MDIKSDKIKKEFSRIKVKPTTIVRFTNDDTGKIVGNTNRW